MHTAQESGRVLAADTAPNQGVFQPLLAPSPSALGPDASQQWPDHAAVDLRHIARSADLCIKHAAPSEFAKVGTVFAGQKCRNL